jgi:hypothetical protein
VTRLAIGAAILAGLTLVSAGVPAWAKGKPGGGGVSHKAVQSPPVQLGTSGGWRFDSANGYCCGGTIGALVDIGGTQYLLSNWHVFAADTVAGGNGREATEGDPVIQPGLIDVGCNAGGAQTVGYLAKNSPPSAQGMNVDAAIALAAPGMVSADGAILEVGTTSNQTLAASLGLPVKKSGRTTGLSRSVVTGLNAEVTVAYDNECAGQPAFSKTYVRQILVRNRGSRFLNSGDSGSLMLEDADTDPRAVGLLFAGNSSLAVANPIGEVLAAFGGATMVGVSSGQSGSPAVPSSFRAAVERARAAQERHVAALRGVPESVGHAIGLDAGGRVVIKVLLATDSPRARAAAPRSLDGVPVAVEVVGKIVAF